MELYTIQIPKHRLLPSGVELIDTTAKGRSFFAPDYNLVMMYKGNEISEESYTEQYYDKMRFNYSRYPENFIALLNKDKIALACYCGAGVFCHRHLLKDMLIKVGASKHMLVIDKGEIC